MQCTCGESFFLICRLTENEFYSISRSKSDKGKFEKYVVVYFQSKRIRLILCDFVLVTKNPIGLLGFFLWKLNLNVYLYLLLCKRFHTTYIANINFNFDFEVFVCEGRRLSYLTFYLFSGNGNDSNVTLREINIHYSSRTAEERIPLSLQSDKERWRTMTRDSANNTSLCVCGDSWS